MHVQSCCFANLKSTAFLPFSLPSASSLLKLANIKTCTLASKTQRNKNSKSILANLVLVKFTAFKLFFSLALKCDNHKTDEDVDHEKGDDYDIYYVVYCHPWTVVLVGSLVRLSRVN